MNKSNIIISPEKSKGSSLYHKLDLLRNKNKSPLKLMNDKPIYPSPPKFSLEKKIEVRESPSPYKPTFMRKTYADSIKKRANDEY